MTIGKSIEDWTRAFEYARYEGGGDGRIYFMIEAGSILLTFIASLWLIRRDPAWRFQSDGCLTLHL